jgi:hypothetical protein
MSCLPSTQLCYMSLSPEVYSIADLHIDELCSGVRYAATASIVDGLASAHMCTI